MVVPGILLSFLSQSPWFPNLFWMKTATCHAPQCLTKVTEKPKVGAQHAWGFTKNS